MSQSDNVEINSSNAPNLFHNVEDNNDNEDEEFHCQPLMIRRERKRRKALKIKRERKSLKLGITLQK